MDFAIFGDIIFFAFLAGYIWFKLRATLGRKDDAVPPPRGLKASKAEEGASGAIRLPSAARAKQAPVTPRAEAQPVRVKQPVISDEAVASVLRQIGQRDRSFTPGHFLEGAGMAFEMVLDAYAKGDLSSVKSLLDAPLYQEFKEGVDQRNAAGETLETTIVAMKDVEIVAARLDKTVAELRVRFTTEQISVTRDSTGKVVDGSPSHIATLTDEWLFQRDISSANPNWTIVAT